MCQNVSTLKRHYEPWQDRPIEVLARTGPARTGFSQSVEFLEEQSQILHTTVNKDSPYQIDFNFYQLTDQDGGNAPELK